MNNTLQAVGTNQRGIMAIKKTITKDLVNLKAVKQLFADLQLHGKDIVMSDYDAEQVANVEEAKEMILLLEALVKEQAQYSLKQWNGKKVINKQVGVTVSVGAPRETSLFTVNENKRYYQTKRISYVTNVERIKESIKKHNMPLTAVEVSELEKQDEKVWQTEQQKPISERQSVVATVVIIDGEPYNRNTLQLPEGIYLNDVKNTVSIRVKKVKEN